MNSSTSKKLEDRILKHVRSHYHKTKPKFKKVKLEEVEFYLAKPIIWSFCIPKANISKMKQLLKIESLNSYFIKEWYGKPVYNKKGDIVEIPLGSDSDIWPLKELTTFKECVEIGSYCVFQDDTGRFWKIIWEKEEITYWKQIGPAGLDKSFIEIYNLMMGRG